MRVVIVSQYYPPEAVPIPADLGAALSARGHQVRVVTGFPHYPAGRLFDGFRQRLRHVEDDGPVRVRRVPSFLSHSPSALGRALNYLSFGVSVLGAGRHVRGADVVYVYATPMTSAIAPAVWRWTRRLPFVLHVQDLWPESITGSRLMGGGRANRLVAAALTPWLRHLYRSAAATVAIAPTMSEALRSRGLPAHKSHTVLNWGNEPRADGPTTRAAAASAAASAAEGDATGVPPCTVMYAGNLGELQDLETVVRAAHLLGDEPGFRLVLCGAGLALPRLRRLADELGARNVEFWDAVDRSRVGELYARSDFQLVCLKDLPVFRGTVPSKLQGSLAFGVPVITTVRGDVEEIVTANGVGFTAPPEDPEALADVFRAARRLDASERARMGARARDLYVRDMSRDAGVDRLERILIDASRRSPAKGTP